MPTNTVEPRFKINDKVIHKETGKIWTIHWYLADTNSYYVIDEEELIHHYSEDVLESAEQKSADKVEPKFHEGDWVVQGCNMLKIRCVGNEYYCFETVGGYVDDMLVSEIDSFYHLWTIQDAKDGYVLSWDDSKCIAIFKNIYDEDSFNSYGFVGGCTGTFESRMSYHDIEGAHPATKEQRDLLFQKMKEAGYKWDAEKKELKKIEQNCYHKESMQVHIYMSHPKKYN
jgi:hypothetical protein